MIKLRALRWGDGPALSRWARCNQEDASKSEATELGSEREDIRMGAEVGERGRCYISAFEDKARGL